jgi:hypothetical protein
MEGDGRYHQRNTEEEKLTVTSSLHELSKRSAEKSGGFWTNILRRREVFLPPRMFASWQIYTYVNSASPWVDNSPWNNKIYA